MKSALNEKCFHGFGSIFGRIWVHILGGNAYVFENTSTISRCCEKCFQKRKVLSKTKSAFKNKNKKFSKNEKFFKFTKCTRRSGEKFFQK